VSAPVLEVTAVTAAYGKIEAVRDVSIAVEQDSVCCVFGPNGAGKTSLLSTIAGLLRPRRGTIRLVGLEITARAPHERVARGISLVPQERRLFQTMSVHENLWAGAATRTRNREIAADIQQLYDRFDILETNRHRPAGTLSGGEQQILAIARGTLSRPRLLLLDEPTIGLAPRFMEDIRRLLAHLVERGTAILLVEQNLRFALTLANRVYCMSEGRIAPGDIPIRLKAKSNVPDTRAARGWAPD
jgi:branched-chain amino acid transport system ATP-binding protein